MDFFPRGGKKVLSTQIHINRVYIISTFNIFELYKKVSLHHWIFFFGRRLRSVYTILLKGILVFELQTTLNVGRRMVLYSKVVSSYFQKKILMTVLEEAKNFLFPNLSKVPFL